MCVSLRRTVPGSRDAFRNYEQQRASVNPAMKDPICELLSGMLQHATGPTVKFDRKKQSLWQTAEQFLGIF